ncbi:MAG: hypothetical protein ACLFSY_09435 [Desulfonatronovibrionaceae bacterium]
MRELTAFMARQKTRPQFHLCVYPLLRRTWYRGVNGIRTKLSLAGIKTAMIGGYYHTVPGVPRRR